MKKQLMAGKTGCIFWNEPTLKAGKRLLWFVVAKRLKTSDSSSGVSDQQSAGLSPSQDKQKNPVQSGMAVSWLSG